VTTRHAPTLAQLGLSTSTLHGAADGGWIETSGPEIVSTDPTTGEPIARIRAADEAAYDRVVASALARFGEWRLRPAPRRGELVRKLGERLRAYKEPLGELISLEVGKIRSEGLGEVQEMIDICDFAVGLSRQLHGLTIASERPGHRLLETWHPMGPVGVISAFNFPVAVWSWNTALALIAGDPVIWKPSDKTPLTALACNGLLQRAVAETGAPNDLVQVVLGGAEVGAALVSHTGVPVISATGSTAMGRMVAPVVAARFGRSILELGGNNAAIIAPSADLDLTLRGIVFSAAGTAGQRCTSLRRLIVHRSVHDELVERIGRAYESLPIGDPLSEGTLVGPLVDASAFDGMRRSLQAATADGGTIVAGGERARADEAPDA
jgi:aldehyde dehydrogenase (NAD+)